MWHVEQFFPDQHPWPVGVYSTLPSGDYYADLDMYCVGPQDDATYIHEGDWLLTSEDGTQYLVRADNMEKL